MKKKNDQCSPLTYRQLRAGKALSRRAGETAYLLTEQDQDEIEQIRRLNEANGVQHLVDERNS